VREKGKVVEVTGSRAKIRLEPSEACKDCPSCNFCRPVGSVRIVEAENRIGAHVGDEVYIEISPRESLIAIFLFFGLPVLLGLLGLLIGIQYSEGHSIFFGVGAFAIGLIVAKLINNILGRRHRFLPHIVSITRT
jgi:positive regulator of sigma E activity